MKKAGTSAISSPEEATRAKLLEVAGSVFAEHGYQAATVREICARAGANVAAVNYYFRDKMGLYEEVLRRSICAGEHADMRRALDAFKTPEEALRGLVTAMLHKMSRGDRGASSNFRIMAHEMAQPTPALANVVEDVLRPNYNKAREIIGKILDLDPDHDTTRLCAHSLIGQVVHYAHARPVILLLWPELRLTPERVDQIATHIADFTLRSLHALAREKKKTPQGGKNARASNRRTR
ncbi:MAG: CerR family C-terminal domain-containing protein [Acidobacteriota bacterium]|nr:CerR family C-terminal domain-containing protein [Acidobacteriota bacterium]